MVAPCLFASYFFFFLFLIHYSVSLEFRLVRRAALAFGRDDTVWHMNDVHKKGGNRTGWLDWFRCQAL